MADELEARRWKRTDNPNEHKPIDALKAAIRDIEAGNINPAHVIVVYGCDDDDGVTGFYHGGKLHGYFGGLGLLARALQIMGGNP